MGKKKWNDFSTDPDFFVEEEQQETLSASDQQLLVEIDRRKRKGKEVSIVYGFVGKDEDLKRIAKSLQKKLACGGSVKDGEIVIQGNHLHAIQIFLKQEGYVKTKIRR